MGKFFFWLYIALYVAGLVWYIVLMLNRLDVVMTPRQSWNYYGGPIALFIGAMLVNIAASICRDK